MRFLSFFKPDRYSLSLMLVFSAVYDDEKIVVLPTYSL